MNRSSMRVQSSSYRPLSDTPKAEEMVNHGVTGPNVRAAGVDYDVRWAHPYSVYSELDWAPTRREIFSRGADCYDRYRVRNNRDGRIPASAVLEAIDRIPAVPKPHHEPGDPAILAKAPSRAPEGTFGSHHFEDSRGESMFLSLEEGMVEARIPIGFHTLPMFITLPYASKCMIGYKVADIPAIMGSFDMYRKTNR